MSPEIQEWSHRSRSKINNLYLLTLPIKKNYMQAFSVTITGTSCGEFV